jgi:hypothetical protein
MYVLLAEPPDDREPRPTPVPTGPATADQLAVEPILWTFGGQTRYSDAAWQEPRS